VGHDDLADDEEHLKLGGFVVFPEEGADVAELLAVDLPPTDIDDLIVLSMLLLQELRDGVDGVAVEFLEPLGGVGHGDDARGHVSQIEIISIQFISPFGPRNELSQEVHYYY
jgi:hypothetical protein